MEKSPDILIHDPVSPEIVEEDEMDIVSAETDVPIVSAETPREEWGPDCDLSLFN